MITNMACPKCGGTASEYDQNKWACLECGNKFIYAPPPVPQTFEQTNISIASGSLFDLDTQNALSPQPIFKKKILQMPGYFDEIGRNEEAISRLRDSAHMARVCGWICIPFIVLFSFLTLVGAVASVTLCLSGATFLNNHTGYYSRDYTGSAVLMTWGLGFLLGIFCLMFSTNRKSSRCIPGQIVNLQSRNQQLVAEKDDDMVIAHNILCPHCSRCVLTVAVDDELPKAGLEHCLGCGKQYFTTNGYTYPIVFK